MPTKTIRLELGFHRNQNQIFIVFEFDQHLKSLCKQIGANWSYTKNAWYLPLDRTNYKKIKSAFKNIAKVEFEQFLADARKLPYAQLTKRIKYRELTSVDEQKEVREVLYFFTRRMKSARYAQTTIDTYYNMIKGFFYYCKKHPLHISMVDVERFSAEYIVKHHYSKELSQTVYCCSKDFATIATATIFATGRPSSTQTLKGITYCFEFRRSIGYTQAFKKCKAPSHSFVAIWSWIAGW